MPQQSIESSIHLRHQLSLKHFINRAYYVFLLLCRNCHVNDYDLTFLNEGRLGNLKHWYQRILQWVYLEDGDKNYSTVRLRSEEMMNYPRGAFPPATPLTKAELITKFYAHRVKESHYVV